MGEQLPNLRDVHKPEPDDEPMDEKIARELESSTPMDPKVGRNSETKLNEYGELKE